jgi:hypothetical protein
MINMMFELSANNCWINQEQRTKRKDAAVCQNIRSSYKLFDNHIEEGFGMKQYFYNGDIHTMIGDEVINSFLVENEVITAINCDKEVSDDCMLIDLKGKTVIPGFHDSHQHFLCYATDKEKINFFKARSLEDMFDLTKQYISEKNIEKGQWIQGGGWNENNFDTMKVPTREDLDKICPDNPAIFTRACCSTAVANTLALKTAGIFENPPLLSDGVIVVDENGIPTGMLEERARFIVYDSLPKYTKSSLKYFIGKYQDDLLSAGLTTVQTDDFKLWDAEISDILDAYQELDIEGKLKVRFIEQLRLVNHKELDEYLLNKHKNNNETNHFRTGAFKLLLDGSLGGKTAALESGYEGDIHNKGILTYSEDEFYSLLEKAHINDMQLAMHAIGDRAMDMIMDCYEKLSINKPKADPRYRIIHCQITTDNILDRFVRNDVIADIQPLFITTDMEIAEKLLGKERLKSSYNWKTMINKGIHVSGSSDAPVESFEPMLAIYCAVNSKNLKGLPSSGWMPEQKLSIQEAVEMYTIGSAYTSFEEKTKGKLAVGYLADFIVLERNVFSIPEDQLKEVKIEETYIGGLIAFKHEH